METQVALPMRLLCNLFINIIHGHSHEWARTNALKLRGILLKYSLPVNTEVHLPFVTHNRYNITELKISFRLTVI